MTVEGLKDIMRQKEGTEIEFKQSREHLPRNVYESVCAFLNRRGGHVVLGVDDDGKIVGISQAHIQEQLDTLSKDMNNPQVMSPTFYLNFEVLEVDGEKVIYFYVPQSSQAHNHKGVYYDRNQDGDFQLKNAQQIADLMLRKQSGCTENRVLPYLTMDDLEVELFDVVRKRVRLNNENHLWANMTNEEILESAGMYLKDWQTGQEGYTLAAALLFGKEKTLTSLVPFYKTDVLCRIKDTELYDDRDIVKCNLMRAYERLMAFLRRHLPEWPYIEGTQRISLREVIFREVCLNILIHREFGGQHEASLVIYNDRVETCNWNIPFGYGTIDLNNLHPHAKNPTIANFFTQLGIVEELGRGIRVMFNYVPLISSGRKPIVEEQDEFRMILPFNSLTEQESDQADPKNDPVSDPVGKKSDPTDLKSDSVSDQVGEESDPVDLKSDPVSDQVGEESDPVDPKSDQVSDQVEAKSDQADPKSDQVSDQVEGESDQVSKLLNQLVKSLGNAEMSAVELMTILNLMHRPSFRKNYLHPALELGIIEYTLPDELRSPKQKYRLTPKGRLLLNKRKQK